MDSLIGSTIEGKYKIETLLGAGGLGSVYKAEQSGLGRFVAVKVLHKTIVGDREHIARFEQEAKILAELSNQHIVQVYNYGVLDESMPYMVMEYLEGRGLDSLLQDESGLYWRRALAIFVQICDAVSFAHKHGIIHRDLKPQNIFLVDKPEPDFVKILDFGLSRFVVNDENVQKLTQTGTIIGSVHYMSPEVCQGRKANELSDVYSLGCVLYEALGGRPPLNASNPISIISKQVTEMPAPLSSLSLPKDRKIPDELELVVFKSLQKNPLDRFQSMEEFGHALRLVLTERTGDLELGRVQLRNNEEQKRYPLIVVLISLLCIAAAILIPGLLLRESQKQVKTETLAAPLNQRARQQEKGMKFLLAARSAKEKGNMRQSAALAKRALMCIGKELTASERNPSGALGDVPVLQGAAAILAGSRSDEPQGGNYFATLVTNDEGQLSGEPLTYFQASMSRLMAYYKDVSGAMTYLTRASSGFAKQGKPEECKALISDIEKSLAGTSENGTDIDIFIENMMQVARAYELAARLGKDQARGFALKIHAEALASMGPLLEKRQMLIMEENALLEKWLGLYEPAEQSFRKALALAELMEPRYPGMFYSTACTAAQVYVDQEQYEKALGFWADICKRLKKFDRPEDLEYSRQQIERIGELKKKRDSNSGASTSD